jgi:hypothetical protein
MKCKNLATTNFSDFDAASQERIRNQVLGVSMDTASIASSITGVTGSTSAATPAKSATAKRVVFLYNAQALNTDIHHPVLPVSIQSVIPHIHLQLGTNLNDSGCPSIHCIVDTAAALCTGNYHFFAAIAKRYPQCVTKIFLLEDFSPIILSGIVQNNADTITTDLAITFKFHLPYLMKDGSTTSFVIVTGPQVSINTVLGLPLIIATGMIIDFVDEVVEAKHLNCPPFKIDFCRATKTIPATDDEAPTTHYIKFKNVQQILQKTDAYIAGVCKRLQSDPVSKVKILSMNCRFPVSNLDTVTTSTLLTNCSFEQRWVLPPSAHNTTNEYYNQVLGEAGYL